MGKLLVTRLSFPWGQLSKDTRATLYSFCFLTPRQSLGLPSDPWYPTTWHSYTLSSLVPPVPDCLADPLPSLCPTMLSGFSQIQTSTQLSCSQIFHWERECLFPSLDVGGCFLVCLFQSPEPQEHVRSGPLFSRQGPQNSCGLWFSILCFPFRKADMRPQTLIRHSDCIQWHMMTLSMGLCVSKSKPRVNFQGHPSCPSRTLLAEPYLKD